MAREVDAGRLRGYGDGVKEYPSDAAGQRAMLRAERALRKEPDLPPAQEWTVVAHRLEAAGFPEGAAVAWRSAIALEPGLPLAHLGLGRTLLDLGDADGAAASLRAAMEADRVAAAKGLEALLDDPDDDPWYPLGQAEHLRGRLDAAVEAYGKSAERFPWFAEPLLEMARAQVARGDRAAVAATVGRLLQRARHRPELRAEAERLLGECSGS